MAGLCDQDGVLKLRSATAVLGHNRPLVLPHFPGYISFRQHGLDCKSLPWLHHSRLVVPAMHHMRGGVEHFPHSMPHKLLHHAVLVLVGNGVDDLHMTEQKHVRIDSFSISSLIFLLGTGTLQLT